MKENGFLIDFDDIIVHIFRREAREHFRLEQLWAGAKEIYKK